MPSVGFAYVSAPACLAVTALLAVYYAVRGGGCRDARRRHLDLTFNMSRPGGDATGSITSAHGAGPPEYAPFPTQHPAEVALIELRHMGWRPRAIAGWGTEDLIRRYRCCFRCCNPAALPGSELR